ncbi:DUF4147 domain-containing protein [Amycolatopsis magusensis]|uniref:DUF4147 domain-containing protein n=1 Tax=Amycolatopsis magusensis TaxID=882444 RepID=UPI003C2B86E7
MAGLRAVDAGERVRETVRDHVRGELLESAERVFVLCVGKAAAALLDGITGALDGRVCETMAVGAPGYPRAEADFTAVGDHPFPGRRSARAAAALRAYLGDRGFGEGDLVLVGVSGGATAMLADPVPPLDHGDLHAVSAELLGSGIDVTEANNLRRALSRLHAGGLLDHFGPARAVGLVVSDNVQIGDAGVASGLTFPGPTGLGRAAEVAGKHLRDPGLRRRVLTALANVPETRGHGVRVANFHVTGGDTAVEAMARSAAAEGFDVLSLGGRVQGPVTEVAERFAGLLTTRRIRPTLVVGGGEATVELRGGGDGGRCQELAWRVGLALDGRPGTGFAAVASDGVDFLPHSSGAWVDGGSVARATAAGITVEAALAANDTYPAHAALGQIIRHAPGRTNVCDLYVGCVDPAVRR